MRLRRILDAGPEGRTVRVGPEIQELEIPFVLLAKSYAGHASPNRIHIKLNGSVAECDVLESGMPAIQPHQAMKKAQLAQELRVLLRLPAVSRHRDRDRFGALSNPKC